jgi:hypothetical protein
MYLHVSSEFQFYRQLNQVRYGLGAPGDCALVHQILSTAN